MTKICATCLSSRPRSEYTVDPRYSDGLKSYCRACRGVRKRASYQKNKIEMQAKALARYEKKKVSGEITPGMLSAKRGYDRAYREANSTKLNEMKSAWRAKNAVLVRVIRSNYKARRRAQMKGGATTQQILEWLSEQVMVCKWCSLPCEDDYHVDHVEPLARGGEHQTHNMCISCPPCNLRKNCRDPNEFAASLATSRAASL